MAIYETLANGTPGAGRAFTPQEAASYFIDRLHAASVGLASGFTVVRTDRREVAIPRLTADSGAKWAIEGEDLLTSDMVSDTLVATPRKLAALNILSNEVRMDSVPAILNAVGQSMVRALALKLDLGIFEGSGTAPEIRGLKNTSGIGSISMGTNGGALSNLDAIADALGLLTANNASPSAIAMAPRSWQTLSKVKTATGSNQPVLTTGGTMAEGITRSLFGVPVYLTSQLSVAETQGTASNASSIYVYDAAQIIAVIRNDATVEVDSSAAFRTDESLVRCILRADVVVPNPAAVVRIAGVTP